MRVVLGILLGSIAALFIVFPAALASPIEAFPFMLIYFLMLSPFLLVFWLIFVSLSGLTSKITFWRTLCYGIGTALGMAAFLVSSCLQSGCPNLRSAYIIQSFAAVAAAIIIYWFVALRRKPTKTP